jgi:hypothetical protein
MATRSIPNPYLNPTESRILHDIMTSARPFLNRRSSMGAMSRNSPRSRKIRHCAEHPIAIKCTGDGGEEDLPACVNDKRRKRVSGTRRETDTHTLLNSGARVRCKWRLYAPHPTTSRTHEEAAARTPIRNGRFTGGHEQQGRRVSCCHSTRGAALWQSQMVPGGAHDVGSSVTLRKVQRLPSTGAISACGLFGGQQGSRLSYL